MLKSVPEAVGVSKSYSPFQSKANIVFAIDITMFVIAGRNQTKLQQSGAR